MKNNTKKGFTLVELLVVIAILAILATVSVVGYTSYIDGTNLKVDENLAAQLNHFLDAYQVNNREDITTDNVWHVTNDILELGGIDELQAQSDDYHFFFKFDTDEDGNYVGGEYVVAKDVAEIAPLDLLIKAINPEERPGFFLIEGNLYFLVDTTGSALAEAIRGFYTFDHLEGTQAEKWEAFQELVGEVAAEGHINIETALNNNVFVTLGGTEVVDGATPNGYVFHTEDGIVMEPSVNVTISTTVTVPSNVTLFEDGAFNVTYTGEGVLEFEVSAEELAGSLCEGSLPEDITFVVDGEEWEYVCGDDTQDSHITNGTVTEELTYSNPLKDFNIKIEGDATKVHNEVTTEDATAGDTTEAINKIPHIVWDIGSFKLTLDESTFKAADPTKSLSSKRVNWSLVDANGNPVADDHYAGVALNGNTITLSKVGTTYPNTEYFYVKATVANDDSVYATYKIELSGLDYADIQLDGTSVGSDNAIEVFWGETEDGNRNSYTVSLGTKTPDANTISGFVYADKITITVDGNYKSVNAGETKLETSFDTFPADTTTQATQITVNVGGYVEYTINIDVTYARVLFAKMFEDIKYLGTEGTLNVEDLFNKIGTVNANADVRINAYLENTANQPLSELSPVPMAGADDDYQKVSINNKKADGTTDSNISQSIALGSGYFDFNLNSDASAKIILVVTVDGVRASENIEYTVVSGTNVRNYSDLTAKVDTSSYLNNVNGSVVLLRDIDIPSTATVKNISITSGNTLYGNCFTFDIKNGIDYANGEMYGIIRLDSATMCDTKVVGAIYTTVQLEGGSDKKYSANAVQCAGESKIINSYIANTRAPLIVRGTKATLENVMLFGGRYANVDFRTGTIVVNDRLVTINQAYENVVGGGIIQWIKDSSDCKIDITSGSRLIQYNFLSEELVSLGDEGTKILPEMHLEYSGMSVDVNFNKMLGGIFGKCILNHTHGTDCCSDNACLHTNGVFGIGKSDCKKGNGLKPNLYGDYFHIDSNGKRYINLSAMNILLLDTSYVNFGTNAPKDYKNMTYQYGLINVRVSTLTKTATNPETNPKYTAEQLFINSLTAVEDYNPVDYDFVGGNIIPSNITGE